MVLPDPEVAPKKKKESKKRKKSDGADGCVAQAKKAKVATPNEGTSTAKGSAKKPSVSAASANLLAAFLIKKKES